MGQPTGLISSALEAYFDDPSNVRLMAAMVLTSGIVLLWLRRLNLASMSKVPGPWYLKLTSLFLKYHEFGGSKSLWIHGLHLKHGPVVQIARDQVSFASYTSSKQIYSTGNKDFRKTELYGCFRQEGHINLFTALDPDKHSEIRRHLADRYSNSTVLRSKVLDAISARAETFARVCTRTGSADIYLYLHAYALDCVTAMLFHPFGTDSLDGDKDKEMVRLLSYSHVRQGFWLDYYLPLLGKLWKLLAPQSMNLEKGGTMIRDYVADQLTQGGQSDFTLAARLQNLEGFDRPLAISECLDHIGAGIETTGDTLCWLMWEMSQPKHHGRVTRLHEELVNAQPGKGLDTLPYLGAVVQEGLRLYAPGTVPLPRYVPDPGRHIDGYFIPGRVTVGCTAYSMHRIDKSIFPDADEFVPERWLEADGNTDRQRLFFAFGLGARTCIGKHLAMAEMRACLNAVYSKYRTRPASDMTSSMDLDDDVLTARPRDMCCKVEFVPWDEASEFARAGSPSQHV